MRTALYNTTSSLCHSHQWWQDTVQHDAGSNVVVLTLSH
jgi:hypothetical protein